MSLPPALRGLSLESPGRAQTNLALLRERLPEPLFSLLATVLGQVPDPDRALNTLERFTRGLPPRVMKTMVQKPVLLHYLLALFSHSGFLSETLAQQPELVLWLSREKHLQRAKSKEELLEEYARFQATAGESEPALILAHFKRRQYLRITLRDVLGVATLVEITLELSILADVLLEKAVALAESELRSRYGSPQRLDARGRLVPARFAVVSLGKLGGKELNYSSDVDLLFLYDGKGETSLPHATGRISNKEFFVRLAQRVLEVIAGVTPQGPVFRVDLRLRPGGGEGDLVISLPAAVKYYQERAREWELQMLLKARHSAGDGGLVREFLSAVEPALFRGPMHFAAVESVLKAREQMDRKLHARSMAHLNVKLAPGGIRDIEFLVQCLQRLHGREDRWVRAAGTQVGLQKLYEKGYLAARDHFHLASAYEFLRRVEHRLQLEQGQQIHTLPEDRRALELLARRCGVENSEALRQELYLHLRRVQLISDRVLPQAARPDKPEKLLLQAPDTLPLPGELSYAELLDRLQSQASPLYEEITRLVILPRAERSLRRFLGAAFASSGVFEEVERASVALPQGVEILQVSEPLGGLLIRRPERLGRLLALAESHAGDHSRQLEMKLGVARAVELPAELGRLVERQAELASQMNGLRRYYWNEVFFWGAREVCLHSPLETGLQRHTQLAEEVIRAGLSVAAQHAEGGAGSSQECAVIALGRLGTDEMDLGSDADLIFVAARPEVETPIRPLAEKLIHVLSAYTHEGTVFPVDVRLRPRGSEGELVQTLESVLDYFSSRAESWEAITYLKARPVAGDLGLGEEFCLRLKDVLRQRFAEGEAVRSSLADMRRRVEEESGRGLENRDNFRTGAGGIYDLDFLFSAAALAGGATSMAAKNLMEQAELADGMLGPGEREELQHAARVFRVVDHAIRLATGKTAALLPGGARGEMVAELASRWLGERVPPGRLAARLVETRRAVRAIFQRVFG
jgi:glutamate-ammonia-ligase adenylyltransferase